MYLGQHVENGGYDVTHILRKLAQGILRATAPAPRRRGRWAYLSALVQREANVLAYIDGFWLCFWLAMAALFVVRPDHPRAPPRHDCDIKGLHSNYSEC